MDTTAAQPKIDYYFLQGGGELGSLIRAYNWASTPLGSPENWPQSLRTTLSIILSSKFPMFLWWGDDLIQFYNDAYRPSFGRDGKHPLALGQKGVDCWPEIWEIIHPLILQVKTTGEPTWSEDQLIPIHRNGQLEDVYWTFGYSAVRGDSGEVEGVLVVCNETTEKVKVVNQLKESDNRFKQFVDEAALGIVILNGPEMRIEIANDAYGRMIDKKTDDIIGKRFFDVIPETEPYFRDIIDKVRVSGESLYLYDYPYFVMVDGEKREGYLDLVYQPYRDSEKNITGVMVLCHDVTEKVIARQKLQASEEQIRSLIDTAPVAMGLFLGRDLVVDVHNQTFVDIVGKGPDIKGKPLREVMPELLTENQPFLKILDDVYTTGKTFQSYGSRVSIVQQGVMTHKYYNITYSAVYNDKGEIYGILDVAVDVTGEVELREALTASEQRLRSVIEAAPVPIGIMTGREMRVAFANQSIKDAWGKGNDIEGMTFSEMLPELEGKGFYESLDTVYTTGKAFHSKNERIELVVDGVLQPFYYNYSYSPLFDKDGDVYGVMNTAANVTDIEIARQKVENSEQRVRSIIDSAPFPIGVYAGAEKTIAFANQSIMDVWGKGNDVVGKRYTEILPELENQLIFDQITAVYETGEPFHARNQRVDLVVDDKLQSFWFNYSFTPLFDTDGKVYGVMNTAAEVTDLNRAKQKIEESEKTLRNIILQAPMATCIYRGENAVIEVANNAMFEFWGVESKDVLGKPIFEAMPDVGNQGYEEILKNVRETGVPFIANEMTATLKRDGVPTDVYINFSLDPIRETDGTISAILAVAIDVTAQVLARQKIEEVVAERTTELATANQNLQRSNAELEQFAYIASHDLQEPLRKVRTFAQMLESTLGENISDKAKNYLEKINSSTGRMTGLIRDVLHYSQLSRDEQQAFKSVNLNTLLHGIKSDYELLILQKNAQILFGDLPTIEALPQQMSQLFGNLVSNALKFSNDSRPVIEISAELLEQEDVPPSLAQGKDTIYYKIQVKDNGIGFDQEHAEKIFNIFQRLHAKTEYSGTGIGLAMCKKIVLNHHGDIYATSQYGEGATFTIILPKEQ